MLPPAKVATIATTASRNREPPQRLQLAKCWRGLRPPIRPPFAKSLSLSVAEAIWSFPPAVVIAVAVATAIADSDGDDAGALLTVHVAPATPPLTANG